MIWGGSFIYCWPGDWLFHLYCEYWPRMFKQMTHRENNPMNFSIKTSEQENIAILELEGEINMYASPDFRDKLLLVCNEGVQEVIVDFSQVTFMDSSGVATLVEGLKWSKRSEKSFVLKNVGTNVKNSLALTKLDTVFKILPSAGDVDCFH
jgi:anti-sigma B factor antagonist